MIKRRLIRKYMHIVQHNSQEFLAQEVSLTQVFKWVVFTVFAALFIGNNSFYQSLSAKIDRELIQAYQRSDSPLRNFIEVTRTMNPTVVVQQFSLDATPTRVVVPTKRPVASRSTIPEDELWQALATYRQAHGKKDLGRSDSLCQYARKRAGELSERLKTNPDDPLDAHAGFKRDADSGDVFKQTGFNQVGENLAYTPAFTSGTQVIEWGWDTSSGHRALQLSDDITHGCITGVHPIYVGIFGS